MAAVPRVCRGLVSTYIVTRTARLSDCIARSHSPVGGTRLRELLAMGAVYVDGERTVHDRQVERGNLVRMHLQPKRYPEAHKTDWRARVVADERDFVVVNKPSGVPVHPTVDNLEENVQAHLSALLKASLLVTHRLDVASEGLMVLAKNAAFASFFNQMLQDGLVTKRYRALVDGSWPGAIGTLTHWMRRVPARLPRQLSKLPVDDRWMKCTTMLESRTERMALEDRCEQRIVRLVDGALPHRLLPSVSARPVTELIVRLITGRTHQIRSILAFEGCPIIGDFLYGYPNPARLPLEVERIELRSCHLELPLPDGTRRQYSI